jgi:hypothetical protein
MTNHLSPDERVDALDGALEVSRQAHLDACAGCRQELATLRDVLRVTAEDDVPEPSPLFWDHFEARVAAAVNDVAAARVPWWRGSTRAWVTLATAAAVLFAVWISPLRTRVADGTGVPDAVVVDAGPAMGTIGESAQWAFMSGVLETLEENDARVVLAPSPGAVDTAFESLSAAEREAFARLLQAELTEGSY